MNAACIILTSTVSTRPKGDEIEREAMGVVEGKTRVDVAQLRECCGSTFEGQSRPRVSAYSCEIL